ncbi:MAG: transcriptional regulator [Gammaproteobacteria bacterium]|nr:transcriptional regulator [Gammaproteobacteria bacterium]
MPQQHYENLLLDRVNIARPWDAEVAADFTIDDLDHDEIYTTVSDGINEGRLPASSVKENIEDILLRFNLIKNKQLRNAALVLFAKDHACLPQCHLKMARFQGKDKLSGFIDNQQMSGNIFKLLKAEDDFLRRHLPIASTFNPNQFKRIDKPALPVFAVREALINALCHRDYTDRSTGFSLGIFDDRLEIWNSGFLLKNLTINSLKKTHESVRRNKLIAEIFYIRGFIERWGTGTNKMIALCKQDELPEPEFEEHTGGFSVILKFKTPMRSDFSSKPTFSEHTLLSERQKKIVQIFQQYGAINTQMLLSKLEHSVSQRTLQNDLRFLKEQQILTSRGASRKTVWSLKME